MSTTLRLGLLGLLAMLVTAAAGCQCSTPRAHADVCSLPNRPAGCGASCSGTVPCASGTHCAAGRCTAECSAAHPCPSSAVCSAEGSCVVDEGVDGGEGHDAALVPRDAPPADNTCASVEVGTTLSTPNVIVIVDQSGSMGMEEFPTGSGTYRWDALEGALMASPSGLIESLQGSVRWGMAWYHDPSFGSCPGVTSVPCALNNFAAIRSTYAGLSPSGGTPTGEAINQVLATRDTLISDATQPTIFILATDGEPFTCAAPSDSPAGRAYSVGAVQNAFDLGIETYVISVGSDTAASHLQDLANAGVGSSGSPPATFWVATDTTTLSEALSAIVGGVVSCNLRLMGTIDPGLACSGTVTLAGTPLVCGDPDGWHAVDGTHIQLDGTACEMLQSGVTPLTATFPCGVIVI